MTFVPNTIIDQAITLIINTRDFCGDERAAVREFAAGQGFSAEWTKIHRIANFRANVRWDAFKRAAGVNPKHTLGMQDADAAFQQENDEWLNSTFGRRS